MWRTIRFWRTRRQITVNRCRRAPSGASASSFLRILRCCADENYLERRVSAAYALDRILQDHAALIVANLMRLVDNQHIEGESCTAEDVGKEMQPFLGKNEDKPRPTCPRDVVFVSRNGSEETSIPLSFPSIDRRLLSISETNARVGAR